MRRSYLLRVSLKPLIPFIMIFGLYVQFHGDFGPGGGFQAGVIFAAAIILYTLIFGLRTANQVFTARRLEILVAGGVLLYGSVGLVSMALGGNFLDYDVLVVDGNAAASLHDGGTSHEDGTSHGESPSHGEAAHDQAAHDQAAHDDGAHHAPPGQHLGILLVELGVGLTVAAVFVGLFFLFVARSGGRSRRRPAGASALEKVA